MAEQLSLDLVSKNLVTNQIVLTIGYDIDNLINPDLKSIYEGEVTIDRYGRNIPKHAHGTINLDHYTSSSKTLRDKTNELYIKIVNPELLVRKIYVVANNVISEKKSKELQKYEQVNLFVDYTR